jgi:hypothetical protein
MKENLKPILLGIDTEKVENEINLWKNLIESLTNFFADWKAYFNEDLSIEEFRKFQETEDKSFYIGEKYISKQKEYADFMEKLKIKIRKLLDMVEMPPFELLLSGSQHVLNWSLRVHADDLHLWFERCYTPNGFIFPVQLQEEIKERYSTYAHTPAEILAFHYQRRFCEMINLLAYCGRETDSTDLPTIFLQGVLWKRTSAVPWLEKPPRYCEPGPDLVRKGSPLVATFSKLAEARILELIKKFSGEDVS